MTTNTDQVHTCESTPPPGSTSTMESAKQPAGIGAAGWVSVGLAVVILALGLFAIREAAVAAGWFGWSSWLSGLNDMAHTGVHVTRWLVPVAVALIIAGCWLLLAGVRSRAKRTAALASQTGVFLTRRGVKHLVQRCADDVDGVISTSTDISRTKVVVRVSVTDVDSVLPAVRQAVQARLSALDSPPTVQVKARRAGGQA